MLRKLNDKVELPKVYTERGLKRMVYSKERSGMKKIINDPNCVVDEMLKGIEISNPDVFYDREGVVLHGKRKVTR